jgi:hypothetical protein
MQVEYIKESEAPKPPKPLSKSAAAALEVLTTLKDGQVAKVTPSAGQTIRGLKASFTRAAKGQKLRVQTWNVNDDPALYVKKVK